MLAVYIAQSYLLLGFIYALYFAFARVHKVDSNPLHANWKFRLLIPPGAIFDTAHPLELQGQLLLKPFPLLRTVNGKDVNENPLIKSYPLVNAGKSGTDS